jgi:diadenosine tetraphosphate (Ap4A) HIT family hydrolase
MDCQFCKREDLSNRIIIENDLAFAFLTHTPIVPGHILISPKRHIKYYEDHSLEEIQAIEKLRGILKTSLKKVLNAEGFNYAWNEEKIGGQSVEHFHLHVIPRKQGDAGVYQYEPREFLYRPGARTQISPDDELIQITKLIKCSLI